MSKSTFVDFRAVKSAVSMEQVLIRYNLLETLHGSGETRRGPCPIHNGSNKNQFSVNLAKNIWNCFSDCKCGGNVLDFVAKREGIDIHKAALLLCEWFKLNIDSTDANTHEERGLPAKPSEPLKKTDAEPESNDKTPNKPLGFALKDLNPSHPYLAGKRGVSLELANEFGIGFFPGSKGLMVGRIVIPIHNPEGKLVAYAGRLPEDSPTDESPKYRLPPGFKKRLELYNLHRAIQVNDEQPFILVEGFFGCIRLWQHGARRVVAAMGSSLSPEQEDLILKHTTPSTPIVIIFDEDESGRTGRGDVAARLALHRFVRVHRFEAEGRQPSSFSAAEVNSILSNGRPK
jgi:DNA primase